MGRVATGLKCAAYVVVLLGLTVAVDRLLAQRFYDEPDRLVPAYRSFNERSVGAKMRQLDLDDTDYDALVIGNSRTLFGVKPMTLDRRLAREGVHQTSFNLAMPTVDVRFWPGFFEDYFDREPPRHVLLGVIPRDLDVRNVVAEEQARAFRLSPGFANRDRTAVWKAAEEALSDLFTLRGRGRELRRAGVRRLFTGEKLDRRDFGLDGERGWAAYDPDLALPRSVLAEQARRLRGRSGTLRLQVGREHLAALARLDRQVRENGGCLTLFTPPVLYDRERFGTVEVLEDFRRVLRDFVRAHPTVGLVDLGPQVEGRYGLREFGDGDHLSPSGAERFSRELAEAVAPRLRGRACAPGGDGVDRDASGP